MTNQVSTPRLLQADFHFQTPFAKKDFIEKHLQLFLRLNRNLQEINLDLANRIAAIQKIGKNSQQLNIENGRENASLKECLKAFQMLNQKLKRFNEEFVCDREFVKANRNPEPNNRYNPSLVPALTGATAAAATTATALKINALMVGAAGLVKTGITISLAAAGASLVGAVVMGGALVITWKHFHPLPSERQIFRAIENMEKKKIQLERQLTNLEETIQSLTNVEADMREELEERNERNNELRRANESNSLLIDRLLAERDRMNSIIDDLANELQIAIRR